MLQCVRCEADYWPAMLMRSLLLGSLLLAVTSCAPGPTSAADDLRRMCRLGYDAVLMGTEFMSHPDPGSRLKTLMGELHGSG